MLEETSGQQLQNNSAKTVLGSAELDNGATIIISTSGPDPVALALSGTVVTLLLLCLCCLCKFRGKTSPLVANNDAAQPTLVVTQRTYFHSASMDQPPPYTPPPEFPGNVGLWTIGTLQKCPDTPPPPYSVTIAQTTHHVLPETTVSSSAL